MHFSDQNSSMTLLTFFRDKVKFVIVAYQACIVFPFTASLILFIPIPNFAPATLTFRHSDISVTLYP